MSNSKCLLSSWEASQREENLKRHLDFCSVLSSCCCTSICMGLLYIKTFFPSNWNAYWESQFIYSSPTTYFSLRLWLKQIHHNTYFHAKMDFYSKHAIQFDFFKAVDTPTIHFLGYYIIYSLWINLRAGRQWTGRMNVISLLNVFQSRQFLTEWQVHFPEDG